MLCNFIGSRWFAGSSILKKLKPRKSHVNHIMSKSRKQHLVKIWSDILSVKYFLFPKSWTQITFYSSPGLFIDTEREV